MAKRFNTKTTPIWLKNAIVELPLQEILEDSLYYPACGSDTRPIKYLQGPVCSFVYADLHMTKERLIREITNGFHHNDGLLGYFPILMRDVKMHEVIKRGWSHSIVPERDDALIEMQDQAEFFAFWTVFERNKDLDEMHGPEMISFFYIVAEAAAAYQGLYFANNIVPKALAIINPGMDLVQWGRIERNNSFFASVVRAHPRGMPRYLLTDYNRAEWSEYSEQIVDSHDDMTLMKLHSQYDRRPEKSCREARRIMFSNRVACEKKQKEEAEMNRS